MVSTSIAICCIAGAIFGILGSTSFITSYIILPEIRTRSRLFILTLSIYNFLLGLSVLLPGYKSNQICVAQCFLSNYALVSVYFWIFLISLIYYLQICRNFDIENSPKFYWFANLIVQIVSLIIGILTITVGKRIRQNTYWCYFSEHWLIITAYLFILFFLFGALTLYSIVVRKLRKGETNYPKSFQFKMLTLAFVYIFTESWTTAKRLRQVIEDTNSSNAFLDSTQAFFTPFIGFWDFIFFVLGDKFVRFLLAAKCKCNCKFVFKFNQNQNQNQNQFKINDFNDDIDDDDENLEQLIREEEETNLLLTN
ncbi:g protein-coupled receptor [Anaeramoeba ignava]|uniref:G protein-coupled receptor n=1 Tax=Anaeramoeba ignava TaxID=1746090 RepID=A0A9Q0LDS5_ANAIG|nr:g protein-coupled receptor [Anaeramoeba ignava]